MSEFKEAHDIAKQAIDLNKEQQKKIERLQVEVEAQASQIRKLKRDVHDGDGCISRRDFMINQLQAEIERLKVATAQAVSKWISVEDRLPRANDVVLVSFGGAIEMDFIETRLNGQIIGWRRFNQDPPTHWQPLPEPPKECE